VDYISGFMNEAIGGNFEHGSEVGVSDRRGMQNVQSCWTGLKTPVVDNKAAL